MISRPPAGYELVDAKDGEVLVQAGDLVWHEGNDCWAEAEKSDIGHEVDGFHAVARKASRPS